MKVTLNPKRGRERVEVVPHTNPKAAVCNAIWRAGLKCGYYDEPYEVSPDSTRFILTDGGTAEVCV